MIGNIEHMPFGYSYVFFGEMSIKYFAIFFDRAD